MKRSNEDGTDAVEQTVQDRPRRKRRSRWIDDENQKTVIPGMPTIIPDNIDPEQQEAYCLQLQIEDITRRLRTGDLGIPLRAEDRSPSPEPYYNQHGQRMNTREVRTKRKLEDERHRLVARMKELNPTYNPPQDYKPPLIKVSDKVYIPQEDHPHVNFVGLIIGPRGHSLKKLETETNAKVIIRGQGSLKEGKVVGRDIQMPGADEPLHAYITAHNEEALMGCVVKIRQIIQDGIEIPVEEHEWRRRQFKELAIINGEGLSTDEGIEKLRMLGEGQQIRTNQIFCHRCGGAGHIARDCKYNAPSDMLHQQLGQTPFERQQMDSEYGALMTELGQRNPGGMGMLNNDGPGYSSFASRMNFQNVQENRKRITQGPAYGYGGGRRGGRGFHDGPSGLPPPPLMGGFNGGPRHMMGGRGGMFRPPPPMPGWCPPPPPGAFQPMPPPPMMPPGPPAYGVPAPPPPPPPQ